MPISMGIICEKCGIVYLITTRASNQHICCLPRTAGPGMFSLKRSCGWAYRAAWKDVLACAITLPETVRKRSRLTPWAVPQAPPEKPQ
jgi:hypothetical protein